MSPCPEPWGPSQLTAALTAQIVNLDASGLSLRQIAARTAVSTATARVALGWVTPPVAVSVEPAATNDDVIATVVDTQDLELVAAAVVDLVVLAAPVPRGPERAAARFGELVEAPVVITQGAQLPLAGLLLALPVLEMTGLLAVATAVFPPMKKGFYGLRVTLLMGVFMALLREPRAEGATRIRPADLMGRLLSLDRAPEVKTLRRKLAELAGYGRGAQLQGALASHHATTRPDAVGFLYLDGHVRVYTGTLALPKTHIARMRIAGPATEESWARCATTDFTTMGFTAPRWDRPHLRARRTPHRPTPRSARHHRSGRKHGEHPDVATDRAAQPRRASDPDPDQPHRPFRPAGGLPDGHPLAAGELLQIRPRTLRPGRPGQLLRPARRP